MDEFYGDRNRIGGVGVGEDVRSYVTREVVKADHPEWGTVRESLAVLLLAERAGLNPSTVGQWLRRPRTIGYFDVDRLLVGIGRVDLWWRDEGLSALREEYSSDPPATVNPTPTERTR